MVQIQISIAEHVIVMLDILFLPQVFLFFSLSFFLFFFLKNKYLNWYLGGTNTGTYLYNFGLSTTPAINGYVIATGAVISGSSFGAFGWDTDHTSQIVQ